MNIYVAASFEKKEEVRQIYQQLQAHGHSIAADWTLHKPIQPYHNHPETACAYAIEDIHAARTCDVLILLTDTAGRGMHVELGAAISSHLSFGKPTIYVIGTHTTSSLFYFHPAVYRKNTIEEVLEELQKTFNDRLRRT